MFGKKVTILKVAFTLEKELFVIFYVIILGNKISLIFYWLFESYVGRYFTCAHPTCLSNF